MVLCGSSHALLYLLHGRGASLQFFTCCPLIVHGCGGSLWFFTCCPLIVHGCVVLVVIGDSSHALLLLYVQYMGVVLCGSSHGLLYLYMGFSSCGSSHALLLLLLYLYIGVDLLCLFTWSSLLVQGCGCFVVLHMIFYFYLYMGVVVLWFFTWSSSLLAHGCYDNQFWHPAEIKPDIDSFLPSVEQQKKKCTSSQVVSFALTHTIGHNQYLIIRKFQTLFASCIALLNLVTFFWGMRCRWRWGIVIRQSDSETITLGFFRYMSRRKCSWYIP